jgi:hypothetical protein
MYQLAVVLDQIIDKSGKRVAVEAMPLGDFYTNIPRNHYAYPAVKDLVKLGVFSVPKSRKFSGNLKLSRIEFYSYLAAFLERLEGKGLPQAPPESVYKDLSKDHPAYIYVQKLVGAGLLSGKGKFRENMIINRYEMAIFVNRILDFYLKLETKKDGIASGYIDIPKGNYARRAIDELVEIGILKPGEGQRFSGDALINRYFLVDLIAKVIEKVVLQEEVQPAPFARSYKDVPVSHFAYPSIQKLITLKVIPPGNREELFYGDRKISRYQMAYFTFSAVEYVLSDVIAFQPAHSSLGYYDVPTDYFVFDAIQKLIWLDVLEGGLDKKLEGDEFVDRYETSFFTVNLINAVFKKIEELKEEVYRRPAGYGFETFLNTQFNFSQMAKSGAAGQDLADISAFQQVDINISRRANRNVTAYASLSSRYNFGDTTTTSAPFLDQAYLLVEQEPFVAQVGRTDYYQGYTPFGNSLYIDMSSTDIILTNYDHHLFNLNSIVGKLAYLGDLSQDSNFGTVSLSPKLPARLGWLDLTLGASLITDLPDPTFTYTLPTRVVQNYAGVGISVLNVFEFTAEMANLNFSDPSVFPVIGMTTKEDTTATQYSLSYFSEDFGYVISFGYQIVGDDYYLSRFADPTVFVATAPDTESILFRTRYYPTAENMIGADLAYVSRDGYNIQTGISGYYNKEVLDSAYLNLEITRIQDNTSAAQDQLSGTASFSLSL